MKKLVGTVLAVVALMALVPGNAFAARKPLPPSTNGSGVSTGAGGKGGVGVISGQSQHKALPPQGVRRLPPVGK